MWLTSMVTAWSRSAWSASVTKAHSKGMPRRLHISATASTRPSSRAPVSCRSRPTRVDLPWSTWPTMTTWSGVPSPAASAPNRAVDASTAGVSTAGVSVVGVSVVGVVSFTGRPTYM